MYWSYYPHRSRELVSPVCGIFDVNFTLEVFRLLCQKKRMIYSFFVVFFQPKNCKFFLMLICKRIGVLTCNLFFFFNLEHHKRPCKTPVPSLAPNALRHNNAISVALSGGCLKGKNLERYQSECSKNNHFSEVFTEARNTFRNWKIRFKMLGIHYSLFQTVKLYVF